MDFLYSIGKNNINNLLDFLPILEYNIDMEIVEYKEKYAEGVKDILVELQEYIVSTDDWHLNIMKPEFREKYFEKTLKDCSKIFLAVEDDKVVGLICGYVVEYDEYDKCDYVCPKTGHIEELIVSKYMRVGGLGTKLLKTLEDYFKSIGCEYCHIDVFEPNEMGKNFYNKHNYTTRMRSLSKKL